MSYNSAFPSPGGLFCLMFIQVFVDRLFNDVYCQKRRLWGDILVIRFGRYVINRIAKKGR